MRESVSESEREREREKERESEGAVVVSQEQSGSKTSKTTPLDDCLSLTHSLTHCSHRHSWLHSSSTPAGAVSCVVSN